MTAPDSWRVQFNDRIETIGLTWSREELRWTARIPGHPEAYGATKEAASLQLLAGLLASGEEALGLYRPRQYDAKTLLRIARGASTSSIGQTALLNPAVPPDALAKMLFEHDGFREMLGVLGISNPGSVAGLLAHAREMLRKAQE